MSRISLLLTLLVTVVNIADVLGTDDLELKLVSVVFRHGDRTPGSSSFPTDPNANKTYYPIGRGGLTNTGKLREYHLGQVLKSRYGDFLGDIYYPDILYAQSTDYDRTKMSLELVLAGLFPPAETQQWEDDLDWQPIPFDYKGDQNEPILNSELCPQYVAEFAKVRNSTEVLEKIASFADMMESLSNYTGEFIGDPQDFYDLWGTFSNQEAAGDVLPDWVSEFYPNGTLLDGINFYFQLSSYNVNLKRLYGGALLNKMISDAKSLVNGTLTEGRKLFLYSAHETSVSALQLTLGIDSPQQPAYSSAVFVELWEDSDGEYYFQVVDYTGIPADVITREISGCSSLCPMDEFVTLLKNVTATEYDMECV